MFKTIISNKELIEILDCNNTVIIDCRFYLAVKKKGHLDYHESHIPNAHYAHLDNDLSGEIIPGKTGRHPFPVIEDFAKKCGIWGIDKNTQVVAYDQGGGGIAARLWFLLKWLGHDAVAVLNGGWNHWQNNQLPVSSNVPLPSNVVFQPIENLNMIVNAEMVKGMIYNENYQLVDSRAAERYRGEMEPIDPIAGRIPSAISAPFAENLDENGLFHTKEYLQDRFSSIIKEHPLESTIFYCGSGVTACHNLLALQHAGQSGAKLYAGSWSDWITNPNNPIEPGSSKEE